MHQFKTRHRDFDGFSEFYNREVFPVLQERDSERAASVKKGMMGATAWLLIMGCAAAFILLTSGSVVFAIFIAAAGVIGALGFFKLMTHAIRSETKERIVGAILGYVGWSFQETVPDYEVSPYRSLFLLPRTFDRMAFEDRLSGEAHGASFHSVEAHLEKETRDKDGDRKWVTVFRGQLMTFDFPTKVFGRTIVLRDGGWFKKKTKGDMKRIGLVDPVFEKIFEAYGTDQVEGRVILDPAFMQRMVDLEKAVSGKNIQFGFDQDKLFITVETPDQFEAGSMFKSLTSPERTQKILDEVGAVFDIADGLLTPH